MGSKKDAVRVPAREQVPLDEERAEARTPAGTGAQGGRGRAAGRGIRGARRVAWAALAVSVLGGLAAASTAGAGSTLADRGPVPGSGPSGCTYIPGPGGNNC